MSETKHTVSDLYSSLFETLENLKAKKITVEEANAISNVAQTIVNAGKLECQFINAVGGQGSGFIPNDKSLPSPDQLRLVNKWNSRG
jgi:hypothetical protein